MISESSLNIPEPSNNRNGASKSQFNSLKDEDRKKKHDSAILDEAVVMGVSHKATAQVMKLNNLKATKSDLIQRSNSLHSSNSIKRSKSQRRVDAAAGRTAGTRVRSPLGGNMSASDSDQEESGSDGASTAIHTTTTTRRRSGQPSSSDKDPSNPFMSEAELISFGPSTSTATKCSNRSSNPFLSASESMAGSTAPSPVFTSMAISLAGDDLLSSPISALESANLRPWTTSSSTTLRDSTFSTASDSRSSTRGDGEEIMIFWDGHRDSKASNL
ncbi:hypothetical protein BGZ83_011734 [Gryganskiella cystojenkinii]|nr:hypothetical protein BGZ83_011734 [Gryganskiella cystojenkinii]